MLHRIICSPSLLSEGVEASVAQALTDGNTQCSPCKRTSNPTLYRLRSCDGVLVVPSFTGQLTDGSWHNRCVLAWLANNVRGTGVVPEPFGTHDGQPARRAGVTAGGSARLRWCVHATFWSYTRQNVQSVLHCGESWRNVENAFFWVLQLSPRGRHVRQEHRDAILRLARE